MCHHPGATWAHPALTAATLWGCQTTLPQCCPILAHSHTPVAGATCPVLKQAGVGFLNTLAMGPPLLNTHLEAEYLGWHSMWVSIPPSCGHITTMPPTCSQCQDACCSSPSYLCSCRAAVESGEFGIPPPQPRSLLSTIAAQHGLATSGMGRGIQAGVQLGSWEDPNPAWPCQQDSTDQRSKQ